MDGDISISICIGLGVSLLWVLHVSVFVHATQSFSPLLIYLHTYIITAFLLHKYVDQYFLPLFFLGLHTYIHTYIRHLLPQHQHTALHIHATKRRSKRLRSHSSNSFFMCVGWTPYYCSTIDTSNFSSIRIDIEGPYVAILSYSHFLLGGLWGAIFPRSLVISDRAKVKVSCSVSFACNIVFPSLQTVLLIFISSIYSYLIGTYIASIGIYHQVAYLIRHDQRLILDKVSKPLLLLPTRAMPDKQRYRDA